ncbi:MAG TPA: hypothetical protein VGM82_16265 [Gemmatimonadaceae bacterium]
MKDSRHVAGMPLISWCGVIGAMTLAALVAAHHNGVDDVNWMPLVAAALLFVGSIVAARRSHGSSDRHR